MKTFILATLLLSLMFIFNMPVKAAETPCNGFFEIFQTEGQTSTSIFTSYFQSSNMYYFTTQSSSSKSVNITINGYTACDIEIVIMETGQIFSVTAAQYNFNVPLTGLQQSHTYLLSMTTK